jgi:hypothetical protein
MNGDFIGHDISSEKSTQENIALYNWKVRQTKVFRSAFDIIRSEFPTTLILPSIGNNDGIYHNQPPCGELQREHFYQDLLDIWFPKWYLPEGMNY